MRIIPVKSDLKKATIQDVAERANVSLATVSRALNHPEKVKKSTLTQIMAAMEYLGYGATARPPHKNVILIIVPDLENSFYSGIFEGIFAAANRSDYQFLLRQSTYGRSPSVETLKKLCEDTNAAGIIFLNSVSEETLRELNEMVAVVQCCECNMDSNYSYVTIDDYAASQDVVNFLYRKGKRKIAFINNVGSYKYSRERRRGFEDAMRELGLEINPAWMLGMRSFRNESVISVVTQMFMSRGERPDAVFAVSDTYAAAAIKAIKSCGLSVPGDVGVVGFDNTFICNLCDPPLTTVVQPQFQLGNLACEMLIETIENNNLAPRRIVLGTEFVVRGSV